MSAPLPISTPESQNIRNNQRMIARSLLAALESLTAFDDFIQTIPSDPEALLDPPYGFTTDEAYAVRLWAQHAAAYAALFDQGGTLAAGDAGALADLTRKSAGVMVYVNQGVG